MNEEAVREIWVVEGKYSQRKGWEFCYAYGSKAEASFQAMRMHLGLRPIWRYRVRAYRPHGGAIAVHGKGN